jgi:hypothetical protein
MTSRELIGSKEFNNSENYDLRRYYKIQNFFVHSGGGLVLEDKLLVKRIDNSYDHKLQLSSNIFSYNDTIFRFAGYGFFDNRSFLTFYDEIINEWETYDYNGNTHPMGTHGSEEVVIEDKVVFIGGYFVNPNRRSESIDFNGVQEFSFRSKEWKKVGETKNRYFKKINTIKSETGFIYFGSRDNQTEIVNVLENQVVVLQDNPLHRKIGSSRFTPQIFRDTIFFSNSENPLEISFVSLNDFIGDHKVGSHYFLKSSRRGNLVEYEMFIVLILLLFFVGVLILVYRFLRKKLFVSKKGKIFYLTREMELSDFESDFLKIFFSKDKSNSVRVENSEVLNLFKQNLDIGTITRRKNESINILNEKIKFILRTSENIIVAKKSNDDRRNIYYEIDMTFFYFL